MGCWDAFRRDPIGNGIGSPFFMHIDDLGHRGECGVTEFVVAIKRGPDKSAPGIEAA